MRLVAFKPAIGVLVIGSLALLAKAWLLPSVVGPVATLGLGVLVLGITIFVLTRHFSNLVESVLNTGEKRLAVCRFPIHVWELLGGPVESTDAQRGEVVADVYRTPEGRWLSRRISGDRATVDFELHGWTLLVVASSKGRLGQVWITTTSGKKWLLTVLSAPKLS